MPSSTVPNLTLGHTLCWLGCKMGIFHAKLPTHLFFLQTHLWAGCCNLMRSSILASLLTSKWCRGKGVWTILWNWKQISILPLYLKDMIMVILNCEVNKPTPVHTITSAFYWSLVLKFMATILSIVISHTKMIFRHSLECFWLFYQNL